LSVIWDSILDTATRLGVGRSGILISSEAKDLSLL